MDRSSQGDGQRSLGHRAYTPLSLRFYDRAVLGFNNRFAWRCPTARILEMYQACISSNHLDVGVGTGYYLDRVRFPSDSPRLGLFDRSPNSLAHTARRLRRYTPEVYPGDILEPITETIAQFDSIAMNYLLHCLPGPMASRAVALENVQALLRPNGQFFGSTVLGRGVSAPFLARLELPFWNGIGVFGNRDDSVDELRGLLANYFAHYEIEVRGCVALFRARVKA